MMEDRRSPVFVKNFVLIPNEDEGKYCKNTRHEIMAWIIGECVMPIYRKNYIKSWYRRNKGRHFLENMTIPCLGYCTTLL